MSDTWCAGCCGRRLPSEQQWCPACGQAYIEEDNATRKARITRLSNALSRIEEGEYEGFRARVLAADVLGALGTGLKPDYRWRIRSEEKELLIEDIAEIDHILSTLRQLGYVNTVTLLVESDVLWLLQPWVIQKDGTERIRLGRFARDGGRPFTDEDADLASLVRERVLHVLGTETPVAVNPPRK